MPERPRIIWGALPPHICIAAHGAPVYIHRPWWDATADAERRRVWAAFSGEIHEPGLRYWTRMPAGYLPELVAERQRDLAILKAQLCGAAVVALA